MEKQEVVSKVVSFFYIGVALAQEPHRRGLFRLFKEGYPGVSKEDIADAIFDDLNERGAKLDDAQEARLERLTLTWSDWTYAWENYDPAAAAPAD